ncbi:hypothetical protein BD779DRAFT_1786081 [Infundibulicybe gibba]|nr:hypothetical protein BD779DRAFT_1786081 [Infundibulicybe gibba]
MQKVDNNASYLATTLVGCDGTQRRCVWGQNIPDTHRPVMAVDIVALTCNIDMGSRGVLERIDLRLAIYTSAVAEFDGELYDLYNESLRRLGWSLLAVPIRNPPQAARTEQLQSTTNPSMHPAGPKHYASQADTKQPRNFSHCSRTSTECSAGTPSIQQNLGSPRLVIQTVLDDREGQSGPNGKNALRLQVAGVLEDVLGMFSFFDLAQLWNHPSPSRTEWTGTTLVVALGLGRNSKVKQEYLHNV